MEEAPGNGNFNLNEKLKEIESQLRESTTFLFQEDLVQEDDAVYTLKEQYMGLFSKITNTEGDYTVLQLGVETSLEDKHSFNLKPLYIASLNTVLEPRVRSDSIDLREFILYTYYLEYLVLSCQFNSIKD